MDDESIELEFFDINNLPESMHDGDMVEEYIKYTKKKTIWYKYIKELQKQ